MIFSILASACPLLLCSIGALFSEYAGVLALFLEGIISFSGYLTFSFTLLTGSPVLGITLSCIICVLMVFGYGWIIEKCKGNVFISAIAMNLLFSCLISLLSLISFGTRGVLTSPDFKFELSHVYIWTILVSAVLIAGGVCGLIFSRFGLYIRITGDYPDVLLAKGGNPGFCRIHAWGIAALYGAVAGGLLTFRLSSFVPNISSGRGWMALAAVFLGKKNPIKIISCVLVFCLADIFAANVQNLMSNIPSSLIISLPYIVALVMISFSSEK